MHRAVARDLKTTDGVFRWGKAGTNQPDPAASLTIPPFKTLNPRGTK